MKKEKFLQETNSPCFLFHDWRILEKESSEFVHYFICAKCGSRKIEKVNNRFNYPVNFAFLYGICDE